MDALSFLASTKPVGPLYVVHGDEAFLKRHVVRTVRLRALGEESDDQSVSTHLGDKAAFAEVFDDLDTVPFFDPRRVVYVENADPFITKYRGELEQKLTRLPATGVLILDVKTWASNTRLAKLVNDAATIICKSPKTYELPKWCADWCMSQHKKQLAPEAARLLTELVEPEMGILDQELLKLAIAIGAKNKIEYADVDRLVGSSHTQDVWKIFDAMAQGNVKASLGMIDRLLDQGEEPMRLLGAFGVQLRKLGQAARYTAHGQSLGAALASAGIPPFAVKSAEAQMRRLGRQGAARLYDWLLQLNMDLRGNSPLPARTLFERLVLRLAREQAAASA
jgi:DNA polymerase-3 subunit delta